VSPVIRGHRIYPQPTETAVRESLVLGRRFLVGVRLRRPSWSRAWVGAHFALPNRACSTRLHPDATQSITPTSRDPIRLRPHLLIAALRPLQTPSTVIIVSEPSVEAARRARTGRSSSARSRSQGQFSGWWRQDSNLGRHVAFLPSSTRREQPPPHFFSRAERIAPRPLCDSDDLSARPGEVASGTWGRPPVVVSWWCRRNTTSIASTVEA
jgi:hypothetical protein